MADATSRAIGALEDVAAVEHHAPGMCRVVTVSDEHIVDVRGRRCDCADMEYQLEGDGNCKHVWASLIATDQLDIPGIGLDEDLDEGPEPLPDFADFDPEAEYVV